MPRGHVPWTSPLVYAALPARSHHPCCPHITHDHTSTSAHPRPPPRPCWQCVVCDACMRACVVCACACVPVSAGYGKHITHLAGGVPSLPWAPAIPSPSPGLSPPPSSLDLLTLKRQSTSPPTLSPALGSPLRHLPHGHGGNSPSCAAAAHTGGSCSPLLLSPATAAGGSGPSPPLPSAPAAASAKLRAFFHRPGRR